MDEKFVENYSKNSSKILVLKRAKQSIKRKQKTKVWQINVKKLHKMTTYDKFYTN